MHVLKTLFTVAKGWAIPNVLLWLPYKQILINQYNTILFVKTAVAKEKQKGLIAAT